MSTMRADDICAVVVTYQPELHRLKEALRILGESVKNVVVVDNGSTALDGNEITSAHSLITIRRLTSNQGIAAAQNEGIAIARRLAASYILFLDQDSIPDEQMVITLRNTFTRLAAGAQKVACVGPGPRGRGGEKSVFECDYLISSGTLIPLAVIDEVGGMEDDLFIDRVDIEWCLRARSRGYRIYADNAARLDHRLGEGQAYRIWFGRWRRLPRHAPVRYYYMFRNSIILFRRRYVPARWISREIPTLCALFLFVGVFGGLRALRMMLKGVHDGVRGVTGKLEVQWQ